MPDTLIGSIDAAWLTSILNVLSQVWLYVLVFAGFSLVIFVHELGHFLAAKWCDVRIDRFAVGFLTPIFSYRQGMGFRWGSTEKEYKQRLHDRVEENRSSELQFHEKLEPTDAELARAAKELKLGETDYCFNVLPLGGYVKMLGQEDFAVDKSGELMVKDDPRAFTHKPIGQRMFIVSAGVIMNLVFAAFVFMLVFMIGLNSPSSEIGMVIAGSPAYNAGLQRGDVITKINGRGIADRQDMVASVVLSDPDKPLEVTFKRKDPTTGKMKEEAVAVRPEVPSGEDTLKIGVAPAVTTVVAAAVTNPALPAQDQVQKGDKIVAVEGKPVSSFWDFDYLVANARGGWVNATVERPAPDGKGEPEKKDVRVRARLFFDTSSVPGAQQDDSLLGFVPRRMVYENPESGSHPEGALHKGDVIVRWGGVLAPRLSEIRTSIRENAGKDISVTVLRAGKEETVTVRPPGSSLLGRRAADPMLAFGYFVQELDPPVVADIVTDLVPGEKTAAAGLKDVMPRGSLLKSINDQPVASWNDVVREFLELGGQDVKVSWVYGDTPEQTGMMHVPQTIETAGHLPQSCTLISINGVSRKEVEFNGRRESYSVQTWLGEREILRDFVGQEVTVEYSLPTDPGVRTATVRVTPEMLDTWPRRVVYTTGLLDIFAQLKRITVQETNPIKAMMIGIWKTYYFIENVYITMERMLITRSVSMDQVSGPVGIFRLGSGFADLGMPYLLYFLALISANLAVINFMPLPIVDGGLFVFLLIEKLKGKPISLRVQVATQVIGLALIACIFVVVTFQDILNWNK
jgi:regulator of sigma E protease